MRSSLLSRLLFAGGAVALTGFFMILHASSAEVPYSPWDTFRFPWTIAFIGIYLVASYGFGLPDLPRDRLNAVVASAGAVAASILTVSLAQLLLGTPLLPRLVLGGASIANLVWAVLAWTASTDLDESAAHRAFVVASPSSVAELRAELIAGTERPVELVGSLNPDNASRLLDSAAELNVGVIVIDTRAQAEDSILADVTAAHRAGVKVRTLSLFYEEYFGKIPIADMERMSLLFDIGELHRVVYVRMKRLLDLLISLLVVPVFLLSLPAVFVGNLVANRGPLFYTQPRVGKDGRVFEIVKYRSMRESGSTSWTVENDPRITRFGSVLRRSHVDELPQILNIVKGDLSFVGPRPEQPTYVTELIEKVPFFDVRHLVRPGLTGWAQVKYAYGSDVADAREKLQYDLYYLRRQTLRLDLRIVVRTIRTVFGREGR